MRRPRLGVKVSAVAISGYVEYPDDLALTQLPALAIALPSGL
ncbi:MAG: hypothetical protein WEG36_07485 [Gemmatimonadota bacterium]